MQGRIAAVLDGGACDVGVESTVLDVCHTPPRLLRPGGITPAMLTELVGEIIIDPAVTQALAADAVAASPGMKYKHYAPQAQVTLVTGCAAAYRDYVERHADEGVFALCFDDDLPHLSVGAVAYGPRDDAPEQARRLFDCLRRLDECGAKTVYAACPSADGLGLAVLNRLLRAAAFRVVPAITVVGLTGPTGSGKSTVCDAWRASGIPVIDTDALARRVVMPHSPCLAALVEAFSPAILNRDGSLNRAALAAAAFSSPKAARRLGAITHPAILALTRQEIEAAARRHCPCVVVDAPLLFESGFDSLCQHIVAVIAPAEVRKERIMARDSLDAAAAERRMAAQQPDAFYCRAGVAVIPNDADVAALKAAAQKVWESLHIRGWPPA